MWGRARERYRGISPETGDAILYGLSAVFALVTILGSSLALYRQWAELAIGPFVLGDRGVGHLGCRGSPPRAHRRRRQRQQWQ